MEPEAIFNSVLAICVVSFVWDLYLAYRQYRVHKSHETRPGRVAYLISEEGYAKARAYKLDKHRFGFVGLIFGRAKTLTILWLAVLPWFWDLCGHLAHAMWNNGGEIWQSMVYIAASSIIETVIELPFSFYDTFVIEQTHGFNKQSVPFFFTDRLKKLVVGLLISTPIVAAIIYIVKHVGGKWFFFYIWIFVSTVIFIMMTIYPEFIAPLFDKYTPLPDSDLRRKIEELAARVSFPLKKIYVVEGSKRSAHSNAYMYGFWKNKRIVLYDTLLSKEMNDKLKDTEDAATAAGNNNTPTQKDGSEEKIEGEKKRVGMSDDEILAVLGHELGHWKLYHTVFNLILTEANMLLMLSLFGYLYRQQSLYTAFGFSTQPVIIGLLIIVSFIAAPYNELMSFIMCYMSRRMEFAADRFSAGLGQSERLCSSLIKLGNDNLSLPIDDWLYSTVNHSHPPTPERIEALKKHE